jgi:hypothetical protein
MGASTRRRPTLAERADRHRLYERSVQSTEDEVPLIAQIYEERRGRKPRMLREDFCGTANLACAWVRDNQRHHAVGVDIDSHVLQWGHENNLSQLTPGELRRISLVNDDVLEASTPPRPTYSSRSISATGYSSAATSCLRTFRAARRSLAGTVSSCSTSSAVPTRSPNAGSARPSAASPSLGAGELRADQRRLPVPHPLRLSRRVEARRAFSYDWRLWTLPEVRELLAEAGFRRTAVYWEQTGSDGEGNGEYAPAERGDSDPAWIAYVVADRLSVGRRP